MKICFIVLAFFFSSIPALANKALKVEYRLEAKAGGQEVTWSDQVVGGTDVKPMKLESDAFLSNADFKMFKIEPLQSPPSKPNLFEIELIHTKNGRKKYDEVANKDRARTYCVVIGNEIYQCLGFTPIVKGLWDKSTSVYGPFSKKQAEKLVSALEGN